MKTVSEFIDEVQKIKKINVDHNEKSDLLFRGQKAQYKLEPSIKWYKHIEIEKLENLEKLVITEFKRLSPPFIDIAPTSDFDWLVLCQHFGLPTRLLDWTYNPLAALWFAVSKFKNRREDDHDIGSVWIFSPSLEDYQKQQNLNNNQTIFDIQETIIYRPRNIASRVINQSSVFTLHSLNSSTEIENDSNYKSKLHQIKIEVGSENDILEELHSMNFNESTIYPDLSGLCKHLKWRYFERR